jgi:hypothetical protein
VGQQLVLKGKFFVSTVYLWVVLGLDAFQTGKHLLPLSVAMLVFALLGQQIAARRSPRTVAQLERRARANRRRDERCPRESGRAPRLARYHEGVAAEPVSESRQRHRGGPRLRSAVVPLTAIIVYVTRPGGRANELLAAVAAARPRTADPRRARARAHPSRGIRGRRVAARKRCA